MSNCECLEMSTGRAHGFRVRGVRVVVWGLFFVCYFKRWLGAFGNDLSLKILC